MVQKYHKLAIILHWVMAICIIGMLAGGYVMANVHLPKMLKFDLYQYHKSLGICLLVAFFARLAVRLVTTTPELSENMKPIEKIAAKAGHLLLYSLMFAMPFSGWLLVSSSSYGLPTMVFGAFEFPHFPSVASNHNVHELAEEAHEIMAYVLAGVILLHIAAVLKHHLIDHENLLPRMGIGKIAVLLTMTMFAGDAVAKDYKIDYPKSYIQFSGKHADRPFQGAFEKWSAKIAFDENALDKSKIEAEIDMASAKIGDAVYDKTLPSKDWFNVVKYPEASFVSNKISANNDGSFKVEGDLTIKNITKPIIFNFYLEKEQFNKKTTTANFMFSVKRLDFGIGRESDEEAEWVDEQVLIKIHIQSSKR
jgi:cytochrome b561/polyisoprenoid-binding protein YceI